MIKSIALALSIFCSPSFIIAQQKAMAEANAANVKMVDCDDFNTFHEGYCVIKKGNKTGLIDSLGNIVIKYTDKYNPVDETFNEGFREGMLPVTDVATGLQGYMNKQLKLIIPCVYLKAGPFTNGYARVDQTDSRQPYTFVSKTGAKISKVDTHWGEVPLFPVGGQGNPNTVSGFDDQFGKRVFNFKFDRARKFSEGLAAVMRLDEVGKPKWGFIDTKGKIVIDFKYSIEPGDFREGWAIVVPTSSDDIGYAYIDKTGTVKLSVPTKDYGAHMTYGRSPIGVLEDGVPASLFSRYDYFRLNNRNFLGGLALLSQEYGHYTFIDTLGNKHIYPDIADSGYIRKPAINPDPRETRMYAYAMNPPFIEHMATFIISGNNTSGLMNDRNEVIIDPVFKSLEAPLPGQKLLKAFIDRGNKVSNSNPNKSGFVNLKGEFVILKAAPGTW